MKYKLFAGKPWCSSYSLIWLTLYSSAVYHHGSAATSGHYTLDVLHPNRNSDPTVKPREGWIRIDDELVSDMRTEDVFPKERDCAYLLFYRRIGGTYASRV